MKATATLTITNAARMSLAAREAMVGWLTDVAVELLQNGTRFPKMFRRRYISERKPKRKS